ncbi:sulfatase [Bacillus coahuilensis m2-6]|uniref:alkaline phosphatase family protein n=1 Tax=Bacillus coahuilensis TaxID=408580 RepID=UPI00075044AB|nr:alkaline phosphatase family protein [Bacillus coahuilensis]KUP06884.1 sulfatase [Bacillus coahuilensis m2-6]
MKRASKFEKIAARCWNLLNEGKPFTPIFVIGTFLLYQFIAGLQLSYLGPLILSFFIVLPLMILYFFYDFPLFLRNYLWIPVVIYLVIGGEWFNALSLIALGLYFFFTVFFWGTFYYHLRIGTTWWNFKRFWKLVLKHSDSTSGNAQEQLPKFLLLVNVWQFTYVTLLQGQSLSTIWYGSFYAVVLLIAFILHRYLFDWKPKMYDQLAVVPDIEDLPKSEKVIVVVIDGMRKERFYEARTPFLDKLKEQGTEYTNMETVYPARTVVCFSSMFTGTYPHEHGIKSNMVWTLGIKVESIFDSLRKIGKKGRLLGIAHLVDSFGSDVDPITAVMKHDEADRKTIDGAKEIMRSENPDLFVVQLIGTDQIGHSRGVLYDDYIEKIEEADRLVEEFVEFLQEEGYMKNTTFIVCADHGQADGIGGHGHLDEGERFVPFIMHGPDIVKGKKVEEKRSLVSLASTIAFLLGAPFPDHAKGPVLTEAFKRKDQNEHE